ncbi:MAG: tetratricopeptide repeat protein [Nitrospira sp.]
MQESLEQSSKAIRIRPNDPDGYFQQGMAYNGLNSPDRALRSFKGCLRYTPNHLEAERNVERLKLFLSKERTARRSDAAGVAISVGSFLLLLALWSLFLTQPSGVHGDQKTMGVPAPIQTGENSQPVAEAADAAADPLAATSEVKHVLEPKIDKYMILTFTPILLGLTVVGAVLPWMARLKLPGMEAELQQSRGSIGAGPTGQTDSGAFGSFGAPMGSAGVSIDTGPR